MTTENTTQVLPIGNAYSTFVQDCYAFNFYAGKSNQATLRDIKEQTKLILEESKEIEEGINVNSVKEVLDGAVDTLVTTYGLLQKLQYLDIDVQKALRLISENNLSKFTKDKSIAEQTIKYYAERNVTTYIQQIGDTYVIKRLDTDKVVKPINFVSVDLTSCIPENLLQSGFEQSKEN